MTLRKLLELQQLCKQQSEDVPERILACLLSLWTGVLCGWVDYSMPRAALFPMISHTMSVKKSMLSMGLLQTLTVLYPKLTM